MINTYLSTWLLFMPGGSEMILLAVILLIMFGGKKIPELMRGLGKGIREFKEAKENATNEFEKGKEEASAKVTNNTASI